MTIVNLSPWDTKVLRLIVRAVIEDYKERQGGHPYLKKVQFLFTPRRKRTKKLINAAWKRGAKTLKIILPDLVGDEWIGLVRQQYGTNPNRPNALTTEQVAALVYLVLLKGLLRSASNRKYTLRSARNRWADWKPDMVPELMPIEIDRPVKDFVPVDRQRERYNRILELQKVWQRKAKLAATKLKKLAKRRVYYERTLENPAEQNA